MLAPKNNRVEVVDALRGFAILAIMLLHNIEHFDFYFFPESLPAFIKTTDGVVWQSLFFLFGGKAYAIFALLFGFTFFIQMSNRAQQGKDFRGRFLWRLLLLLGFGVLNSIFYQGDILLYYAIMGVSLVAVCKWSNKAILITAIVLLIQPLEWFKFFSALSQNSLKPFEFKSYYYFGLASKYMGGDSFLELAKGNLTNGKIAVTIWTWEVGRVFQAPAMFMLGMLLGRTGKFVSSGSSVKFWRKGLIVAAIAFVPLFYFKEIMSFFIKNEIIVERTNQIVSSWSNFAFTWVLVSSFFLLYQTSFFHNLLSKLQPFGRMSLSNYVIQSIVGSFIYYGYGLGVYKYTGATYSLIIGIVLFSLQLWFCKWWLKNHKQGPLETLWHKATWIKS